MGELHTRGRSLLYKIDSGNSLFTPFGIHQSPADTVRVGPQGYPTVSVGQRCFVLSSASLSRDLCMSVSFLHLVVCPRSVCGTDSVTWAVGCFPLLGGSVLGFLGASTWPGKGFRAIGRALCVMLAKMFSCSGMSFRLSDGARLGFTMLLLLVCQLSGVDAVDCVHCHGNLVGCHGSDDCPSQKVINNIASMASGAIATGAVIVTALLPLKVLKVFTRTVLDTLQSIHAMSGQKGIFDVSGKSEKEVFEAAIAHKVSSDQALLYFQTKLMAVNPADEARFR